MKAKSLTLIAIGTLLAFAIAAAPASRTREVVVGQQPTPYSADHARIQGEPAELPSQN